MSIFNTDQPPDGPRERQIRARGIKCPTCGVAAGMYCVRVADGGHPVSKNPNRAPRRRGYVHDLRMAKLGFVEGW